MTKQQAIEKVRKCLALSKSANEHEASLALSKAMEIMAKFSIDKKDVEKGDYVKTDHVKRMPKWEMHLAGVIAYHMGCSMFHKTRKGYYFFGREAQIQASQAMIDYVKGTIKRLAKEFKGTVKERNEYVLGLALGISERLRLKQVKFATETQEAGLVPLNLDSIQNENMKALRVYEGLAPDTKFRKQNTTKFNRSENVEKGLKDSEKVSLADQVKSDEGSQKLIA